ncbi:MAG: FtsX-like permease family protein [Eubacteriales bacterium]|nr:FtsX-like permease family protein [Eubacteriales bacterium]
MKKHLTVNDIALGNLKQHKKQYIIMIIGIILAMIFSSSVTFFMFSANETRVEEYRQKYGNQNNIIYSEDLTAEQYNEAYENGYINGYGLCYTIGYAYSNEDEKHLGSSVSWLDDKAKELSYMSLVDGEYPKGENEIAVEKSALVRLGYRNAQIGDIITLTLDVQNSSSYLKPVEKSYKLVGILNDKKSNLSYVSTEKDDYDTLIPAVFVADNTKAELGGREKVSAYIENFDSNKDEQAFYEYLNEVAPDYESNSMSYRYNIVGVSSLGYLFAGGDYLFYVLIVLIFACCVAIVNSFNTNLKERRKQIGMLRAVGATRRQIIKIYGREALIITLLCVPVSLAISYGIVRVLIGILNENAKITHSIYALLAGAVLNLVVVMLSAFVPLIVASKTSPMQAIRNTRNLSKARVKKVKTKRSFNPAFHIAKRNLKLYSSSRIAVSILLCATILFSCVGFSLIKSVDEYITKLPYDYVLELYNGGGATQADYLAISDLPYFSSISAQKTKDCYLEFEEINDFFRVMSSNDFLIYGDEQMPSSIEELADNVKNKQPDKYYYENKNAMKVDNDIFHTEAIGCSTDTVNKLIKSSNLDIDIQKLNSGEEVILVAPQKAELVARVYKNGMGSTVNCDEKVGKKDFGYTSILTAECPFEVGDEIAFDFTEYEYNSELDYDEVSDAKRKTAKISAIVSPKLLDECDIGMYNPFGILTTIDGIDKIYPGLNYSRLYMYTDMELDDETDAEIMDELDSYAVKYNAYAASNYSHNQSQRKNYYAVITALFSIIVISFVICTSVINNSLSARIRENKRIIGTLRAVGASRLELTKSYIYQMLSMFSSGILLGYGLYILFLIGYTVYNKIFVNNGENMTFNPWLTLVMTLLMFIACSINLYICVRRETKNSIVENIREL